MRELLAAMVCGLVAALGALIVGEYELVGLTALLAGGLFGLVVAEAGLAAAGRGRADQRSLGVVAPATAAAGLVWAAWIASGRDWSFVPTAAWGGVLVAALAAALWVRGPRRRATHSPPSS